MFTELFKRANFRRYIETPVPCHNFRTLQRKKNYEEIGWNAPDDYLKK